jgi:hypothetical protein
MEEATAPDQPDKEKWTAVQDVEIQLYYDQKIWETLRINPKDKSYNRISSKWGNGVLTISRFLSVKTKTDSVARQMFIR